MAENNKTEEEKSNTKLKATTGAWWKTTVVEETEKTASSQESPASEKESAKTAKSPAPKAPRKRTARKSTSADAPPAEPSPDAETLPVEPKPRKRAPRKKKETVEKQPESVKVAETTAVEPVPPAPQVAESSPEEAGPVAAEPAQEGTPAKRAPRKRGPRKKKPVAEEHDVQAEERVEQAVEATATEQVTEEASEAGETPAPDDTAVTEKKNKRPSRRRSSRKKKDAAAQAAVKTEDAEDVITADVPAAKEQEGADTAEPETVEAMAGEQPAEAGEAGEVKAEDESTERRKRRPSRRSRGRRKNRGAAQAEAEVEPPRKPRDITEEDDESADLDFDDDDFDEDRDDRDHDDDDLPEGVEIPELPDDEPEDEKEQVVLKLLINAEEPEECRLALLANGRLESIHVSTINRTQTKNNIYKARIVAIEPNLQAAFVDYGTEKNGFLPFSEIHPEYYKEDLSDEIRAHVENHHWKKLSITDVVEKGQDVLVQVVKEEVGKKGANMTTYLSLPGRSVVLMPGSDSSGISRKISGEERRAQLRTAMNALDIPEGIGWIVRTASADITKTALARDVGYLLRLWEEIKKKAQDLDGVGQVYEDHQSVLRFLREHFDPAIEEILVDDEEAMAQVKDFISLLPSAQRDVRVRLHKGARPIFNQFSVEDQIEQIYQPRVNLPSGGSIVIDPTEALVAIDVNSGSTSKGKNFDQSIYQANLEAAAELARQLRLRDLGGLIVVDFIDMRNKKHIRDVERMVKQSMRRDKAKTDFTRISKFGLMQISRQKLGSPIEAGNYRVCEHCKGRGTVRSVETLALFYLRRIQTGASRKHVGRVECRFPLDVAQYLLNNKRHEISEHEQRYGSEIIILADPTMGPTEHEITLHKAEKEQNGKKQG